MRERVAAQRASGMSIRAGCRDNDAPEHRFYGCRPRRGLSSAGAVRRRAALGEDPLSGHLFVFRSRSGEAKVPRGDFVRERLVHFGHGEGTAVVCGGVRSDGDPWARLAGEGLGGEPLSRDVG